MKKSLVIFIIFNLCLIATVAGLVLLAETHLLRPGDNLYSAQHLAEQVRLRTSPGAVRQAEFALDLVDRRLADLAIAEGYQQIDASISALERALDEAISLVEAAPSASQITLVQRGQILVSEAQRVITVLEAGEYNHDVVKLINKISALKTTGNAGNSPNSNQNNGDHPSRIEGEVVSFLGMKVDHKDFPLTGGHEELQCATCHEDGIYAGTRTDCSHCHPQPIDEYLVVDNDSFPTYPIYNYPDYRFSTLIYPEHFPGECSDCHGTEDWKPIQFAHETVIECLSCHEDDLPEVAIIPDSFMINIAYTPDLTYGLEEDDEHYPGDCILCHTETTGWDIYEYDHDGVDECESCHQSDPPTEHYPGNCMNCHEDYKDWNVAVVNHTGLTDCLTCHSQDSLTNHYNGQCSHCHNSKDWAQATFDHSGYSDCRSCHSKPAKHFKGGCANCHTTTDWGTASFSHKGLTNCMSCHDEPGDHYEGECTLCHSSRSWNTDFFTHQGFVDCQSCHGVIAPVDHYTNDCSTCHEIDNWVTPIFSHSKVGDDCLSCHTAPADHYSGECTNCHYTMEWGAVDFDHSNYTDCLSCHEPKDEHYPGQCSNCHITQNWHEVTVDHTGLDDCASCHTEDGHWPGQCSNCHYDTGDWGNYIFDHSGYSSCRSCHMRPSSHPRGQCSNCHTTDSWIIPTETPTEDISEQSKDKTDHKVPVMRTIAPNPVATTTPLPIQPPAIATPAIAPIEKMIPVPLHDPRTLVTATSTPGPPPILPTSADEER
jgi:hypothetical protein